MMSLIDEDQNLVYPVTVQIKLDAGQPEKKTFDCLEDLILFMRQHVEGTITRTDRMIVPRGAKPTFYHNNMFGEDTRVTFEYEDTHEDCIDAVVRFHMPFDMREIVH